MGDTPQNAHLKAVELVELAGILEYATASRHYQDCVTLCTKIIEQAANMAFFDLAHVEPQMVAALATKLENVADSSRQRIEDLLASVRKEAGDLLNADTKGMLGREPAPMTTKRKRKED